ncbi:hypothetical protein B0J12DRAFT_733651 [Macrophomina phaseolina]|uniref:Ubiquitin-like protease family profile domain-containing protein n=1 Tax=Macrophomina phaseolina TaxID=35725 RepID=A0ABQ8FQR0_9PEZI|nr:hypothetical protein B0J12DRAFT_733651 [Macrophomina phaseolina]
MASSEDDGDEQPVALPADLQSHITRLEASTAQMSEALWTQWQQVQQAFKKTPGLPSSPSRILARLSPNAQPVVAAAHLVHGHEAALAVRLADCPWHLTNATLLRVFGSPALFSRRMLVQLEDAFHAALTTARDHRRANASSRAPVSATTDWRPGDISNAARRLGLSLDVSVIRRSRQRRASTVPLLQTPQSPSPAASPKPMSVSPSAEPGVPPSSPHPRHPCSPAKRNPPSDNVDEVRPGLQKRRRLVHDEVVKEEMEVEVARSRPTLDALSDTAASFLGDLEPGSNDDNHDHNYDDHESATDILPRHVVAAADPLAMSPSPQQSRATSLEEAVAAADPGTFDSHVESERAQSASAKPVSLAALVSHNRPPPSSPDMPSLSALRLPLPAAFPSTLSCRTVEQKAGPALSPHPISSAAQETQNIVVSRHSAPIDKATVRHELCDGNRLTTGTICAILGLFVLNHVYILELPTPIKSWSDWAASRRYRLPSTKRTVLVPMLDDDREHWVLLQLNMSSRYATIYGSIYHTVLSGGFEPKARAIVRVLDLDPTFWSFSRDSKVPQQNNTYDCGVFITIFVLYIIVDQRMLPRIDCLPWRLAFQRGICDSNVTVDIDSLVPGQSNTAPSLTSAIRQAKARRDMPRRVSEGISSASSILSILRCRLQEEKAQTTEQYESACQAVQGLTNVLAHLNGAAGMEKTAQ